MQILVDTSPEEERLLADVFKGYNQLIQPVKHPNETLIVKIALQLVLLINVVRFLCIIFLSLLFVGRERPNNAD